MSNSETIPTGYGLSMPEKMFLWDAITKYLGACGVTKVPSWDPVRDAAAAEVEKILKTILWKRECLWDSRITPSEPPHQGEAT